MKRINAAGADIIITTLLVSGIVFLVNACVNVFPVELDFSEGRYYTIGEQSKAVLNDLDTNVKIYALFDEGKADSEYRKIDTLLRSYESLSNRKVHVEYKDPDVDTEIIAKLDPDSELGLTKNMFLVTNGDKAKKIEYSDLFEMEYDERTSAWFNTGSNAEQAFTDAINYTGKTERRVIYYAASYSSDELNPEYLTYWNDLKANGYRLASLNIEDSIPSDAAVILFIDPKKDLSEHETEIVKTFLDNGGSVALFTNRIAAGWKGFSSVISDYGISVNDDILYDTEAKEEGNRILLNAEESDIIPLETYGISFTDAASLTITEKSGVAVTSVITAGENISSSTDSKNSTHTVAAAAEKSNGSKVAVFGCADFLSETNAKEISGYFPMGSYAAESVTDWLNTQSVRIETKQFNSSELLITEDKANYIGIVTIGIIPIYIFAAGIIIWRRRNFL